MATITQFLGSSWVEGAQIPLQWQLTSGGSFSYAGTLTIQALSEFSITFQVNASISSFNINATVEISLTDQNAAATSGPISLIFNGTSISNTGYTEVSAKAPDDLQGGTAASINGLDISGTKISDIQIWPVGAQTALYIDPSAFYEPSFWVLA